MAEPLVNNKPSAVLDFFLQNLPVLLQPSLSLSHRWSICADDAPKAGRVIGFDEVSELVDDHVVYYEHRRLDETPVEIDIAVHGAGAPAVTIINDLGVHVCSSMIRILGAVDPV